jgi:RNA polymerase sigma-70 factor (ECF subfamily)
VNRRPRVSAEARFEELYRSSAPDLLAYLTRRATDPEEATDILAEVYTVAWRRIDKVPPGGDARLWLFGVARNLLMKSDQHQRSHQALVQGLTRELTRIANYPPDTAGNDLDETVHASLQTLNVKEREVLLLTAWEGLQPREIAKVTGSTANVVRVRLHHARARLRRELRPEPSSADAEGPEDQAQRSIIAEQRRPQQA